MIRKIARPMLASAFVASGADMVKNSDQHRDGTQEMLTKLRGFLPAQYAHYIPNDPDMVTKALGGTQAASASLLALGKAPRLTSATLAALTVPSMLSRYAFWNTQDEKEKQERRNGLVTNVALLGGLMIASADTQGKPGLAWRAEHASKTANKKIQAALPTKSEQEKLGEKIHGFVEDTTKYFADNKDDWLERAQKNSEVAKSKFVQAAATAQERAQELQKVAAEEAGRKQKKAAKNAKAFQKKADKATAKAQKKLKKYDI